VWPAIHGDTCNPPETWTAGNGAWGCYRTHINILEHCLNNKIVSYIVFEDDAQFRPDFDTNLHDFMYAIPDDWEQLYLGGQLQHEGRSPPVKVTNSVYRPFNVNRTHCFAISSDGMLPAYKHISNLPFHDQEHIDHHLGRWHEDPTTKVYCPPRWLVGQMGFSSNVSGKIEEIQYYSDPVDISPSHALYDNPICILYRGPKALLKEIPHLVHVGNKLDRNGYDISLSLAANYANPLPEIQRWYNWIRSEIVNTKSKQLPCLFHPRIKQSDLEQICKVHVIDTSSLEELKLQILKCQK